MRRSISGFGLILPLVLTPAAASASVDLTGAWAVVVNSLIGPISAQFDFVQTGTQLSLRYSVEGGSPTGAFVGTIDPATGSFAVPLPDTFGPFPGLVCTGNGISGSGALDGLAISGTWVTKFFKLTPPSGCFDGGGSFTGARVVCGNGVVGLGEVCDDGNASGGDCCSADCRIATPNGTPCATDACTPGQCSDGTCAGVSACDPCEVCTLGACTVPIARGCQSGLPGQSSIGLRDSSTDPTTDRIAWRWTSDASVPLADFGDPTVASDYTLCVIDQAGGVPTLRMSRTAPAGGLCQGKPCWKAGVSSITYRDADADPQGLTAVALRAKTSSRQGRVLVKGRGAQLGVPALGLTPAVIVRLVRDDAPVCWEATYTAATVNDPTGFKAKSD